MEIPELPASGPRIDMEAMEEKEARMEMVLMQDGSRTTVYFPRPVGMPSSYPHSEEMADRYGLSLYEPYPPEKCELCGCTEIFSAAYYGSKVCCAVHAAGEYAVKCWNAGWPDNAADAKSRKLEFYWRFKPCMRCGKDGKRDPAGRCFHCGAGGSRREAMGMSGVKFYQPEKPCSNGHLSERRMSDSKCVACEGGEGYMDRGSWINQLPSNARSPRQLAVEAGKDWYLPTEPCERCSGIAERRVNNGECRGCIGKAARPEPLHRQFPDMVISKDDAVSAGMKAFRTGNACRNGHKGWRWVSNSGCLTCQGRD